MLYQTCFTVNLPEGLNKTCMEWTCVLSLSSTDQATEFMLIDIGQYRSGHSFQYNSHTDQYRSGHSALGHWPVHALLNEMTQTSKVCTFFYSKLEQPWQSSLTLRLSLNFTTIWIPTIGILSLNATLKSLRMCTSAQYRCTKMYNVQRESTEWKRDRAIERKSDRAMER
jgi:hypothetical protein